MTTTQKDKGATLRMDDGGLMADIQELLERLQHVADPEVSRLRARVEDGVRTARTALLEKKDQIQRQARDAVKAGDLYVRDRPWQSVGVAVLAGAFIGFLVGRR